jgi:hypothetical protein
MTRSSLKADLHPLELAINDVIAALAVEAPDAEAGGAQHLVPP